MSALPTAEEILAAVADWLEARAKSWSAGDAYFARIAANAIGIVRRETMLGAAAEAEEVARLRQILGRDGTHAELNALLCAALRDGAIDEHAAGVMAHLKMSARNQIAIDQPNYRS